MSMMRLLVLLLSCFSVTFASFVIGDDKWVTGNNTALFKFIQNTETQEKVLIQLLGGKVEELLLLNAQGQLQSLILGHHGNATDVVNNFAFRGTLLIPFANRIASGSYVWNGVKLQVPLNDSPYPNAVHGFIFKIPLDVVSVEPGVLDGSFTLRHLFKSTEQQGYPFDLDVRIKYTLNAKGFWVTVTATNAMSQGSLPFYHGFHPYFACDAANSYIILDPCMKWEKIGLNSELIPNGTTTPFDLWDGRNPIGLDKNTGFPVLWDAEFRGLGSIVDCPIIRTELRLFQLGQTTNPTSVIIEQDEQFRFVHAYTASKQGTGEDAITFEPMSAETNAFNNFVDLKILDPGQTFSGTFGIWIKK